MHDKIEAQLVIKTVGEDIGKMSVNFFERLAVAWRDAGHWATGIAENQVIQADDNDNDEDSDDDNDSDETNSDETDSDQGDKFIFRLFNM